MLRKVGLQYAYLRLDPLDIAHTDHVICDTARMVQLQAGGVPDLLESPQLIPLAPQKQDSSNPHGDPIFPSPESFVRQSYEVARVPAGFVLKFVLLSTWGDPHYIGLNGCVHLVNTGAFPGS